MNILVTGAEGTVGKPLCEELEARGHNVIRADRFHSSSQNFMRANISQYRQLESIF